MTGRSSILLVAVLVVLAGCPALSPGSESLTAGQNGGGTATSTPAADGAGDGFSTLGKDGVETVATPAGGFAFQPTERLNVSVTRVVDGDTIDVRLPDGSEDTIRLVGIDTPEVHVENDPTEYEGVPDTTAGATCLREAGHDATTYAERELTGRNVTIAFDPQTDRRGGYDRLLAYVYADGQNVNYALVATGHARLYDTEFALREDFTAAETRAQESGRALWTCRTPA
jgi:micrococcal nuclease